MKFTIEDMGVFVCEDRGGAITDNRLDIWFPSCRSALEFGIRKRHVAWTRQVEIECMWQ